MFLTDSPVTSPKEPWIPRVRLPPSLLTGFAGSAFPRFQPSRQCFAQSGGRVGTIEELRLLVSRLGSLVLPCGPIPPLTLPVRSLPCQSRHDNAGTLVSRLRPYPACFGGEAELSHLPREPFVPMPCSSTPARQPSQAIARRLFRPLAHAGRGPAATSNIFEALSHGLGTRCLRFVPPSRTTTQDSLRCD